MFRPVDHGIFSPIRYHIIREEVLIAQKVRQELELPIYFCQFPQPTEDKQPKSNGGEIFP